MRWALTVGETAEALGISRRTVYRLIERGELASVSIGTRRLVRPEAIAALLADRETGGVRRPR